MDVLGLILVVLIAWVLWENEKTDGPKVARWWQRLRRWYIWKRYAVVPKKKAGDW